MQIRVKIKIRDDHRSLSEDFEADELLLSIDSPQIQSWTKKVMDDFGADHGDLQVTIKTSMEI